MRYVLTRVTERREYEPTDNRPIGAYDTMTEVEARLERMRKKNPQYPLVQHSSTSWSIGPEEDEGFFGDHRNWIHLYEVPS